VLPVVSFTNWVGQVANTATSFRGLALSPHRSFVAPFQSLDAGVGQVAKLATAAKSGPWLRIASMMTPPRLRTPFVASAEVGVGHEVKPLSDVRRTDARRAKISRPEGVALCFHVSVYKVDPLEAIRACNLLAKDDWRAALRDEVVECGPEVPLVSKRSSLACRAERLAGAGTGPNRSVVRPAGEPKRGRPAADAGEEVALGVAGEVAG
jgi:hypothetical protein